jgi:aquaporin Z
MIRKLAAEFVGTFWLVFGGCGSAVLAAGFPELGIGFVGVSLAFGLTVLTMAYALGSISGGHFNPAVSLGLAIGGRFSWGELAPYWAAQVLGSFTAAGTLFVIASGRAILPRAALRRMVMANCRPAAIRCSPRWSPRWC